MKTIKITKVYKSSKGHYLRAQECPYFKTTANEPALEGEWSNSSLFGFSKKEVFVFPKQATKFISLSPQLTTEHAKSFSQRKNAVRNAPGLLPGLVTLAINVSAGALRAASETGDGLKGFILYYNNSVNDHAIFIGVAHAEIVDEIERSLSPEIIAED